MTISPPLGVGAVLIASIIGMAWLAPPATDDVVVSVTLPAAVYGKLAQDARSGAGSGGAVMSVGQALAAIAAGAGEPLHKAPPR